jgi:hypothetical protein
MDQLSIHTIENFLGVPLIAPERIHEIDAKEIAATLLNLSDEAFGAREEDSWDQPEVQDEINRERLREITMLLQDSISLCGTCEAGHVCHSHEALKLWLADV